MATMLFTTRDHAVYWGGLGLLIAIRDPDNATDFRRY